MRNYSHFSTNSAKEREVLKKLKYILIIITIAVVLFALFYKSGNNTSAYSKTEFLMDTECTIKVFEKGKNAEAAVSSAFAEISRIENLTSIYIESSDISRINSANANEPIKIDSSAFEIIKIALEISEKSDGAFDITISPVKELWSFKNPSGIPSSAEISEKLSYVNYRNIILDETEKTVTKLNENTKIDLGGIAKGYCGDLVKEILISSGIECGIIDLGGSVTVFGDNPSSEDKKWGIGLQVPFEATGTYNEVIRAYNCSVVSSGSYERYFEYEGKLYHHILDPSTGYPTENGINGVSIIHESSMLADALSTACFVLGREKGTELAKSYGAEIHFE